tara:strand:+ start:18302 stop:18619 length:318 start_codon:yes stop_codon:yes gene_type:complete
MAKIGVNMSIDVTKIEKARLFKGAKGTYMDVTVFIDIDQKDQYDNNGMITQNVSKEEKDAGTRGNILGNCKVFWRDDSAPQQQQQQQAPQQQQSAPLDIDEEIPF